MWAQKIDRLESVSDACLGFHLFSFARFRLLLLEYFTFVTLYCRIVVSS